MGRGRDRRRQGWIGRTKGVAWELREEGDVGESSSGKGPRSQNGVARALCMGGAANVATMF
jgi:hypothetical protein